MSHLLDSVIQDLQSREAKGVKEYGTTMDRGDLNERSWLQHTYEELLDAAIYVKKLITLKEPKIISLGKHFGTDSVPGDINKCGTGGETKAGAGKGGGYLKSVTKEGL